MTKFSFYSPGLISVLVFSFFAGFSQGPVVPTANDYVKPYSDLFMYGANMGYYANGWTDDALAANVRDAGGHTIRTTLPDYFVELHGLNVRVNTFKNYVQNLNMREITNFVGEPSAAHRDNTVYPGCPQPSRLFLNLYEPIWNADGTVNSNNYYAKYIFNLVQSYGDYIRIWEVVNEPDFTGATLSNWLNRAPLPNELVNLWGPFHSYVRMLRITWEVVKKYNPDDYVTPGGIGYYEFLDALCRYTDNPTSGQEGSVTADYPLKGSAYFDMVSYHIYPGYSMRYWSNATGGFVHTRTSDYAAARVVNAKDDMISTLNKYGYNGATFPRKHFIITESNITRRPSGIQHGTDEMQRNYGIKSLVLSQKHDIKQFYFYMVGEAMNAPAEGVDVGNQDYALMGLFENLKRDVQGSQKKTELGIGMTTTSQMLFGSAYDAARTSSLNLPSNIEGGAFKKNDGEFVYVLWAKALVDKSEAATATYTFPSALNVPNLVKHEWNFSNTATTTTVSQTNISLTGTPIFLVVGQSMNLPVKLSSFTGVRISASETRLNWVTKEEDSNTEFSLEKSYDGRNFFSLATIKGGTQPNGQSYTQTDAHADGTVYYRLRWTELSNKIYYSEIVALPVTKTKSIAIFPNPATNHIFLSGTAITKIRASLIDVSGKVHRRFALGASKLDVTGIARGTYFLSLTGPDGIQNHKIILVK